MFFAVNTSNLYSCEWQGVLSNRAFQKHSQSGWDLLSTDSELGMLWNSEWDTRTFLAAKSLCLLLFHVLRYLRCLQANPHISKPYDAVLLGLNHFKMHQPDLSCQNTPCIWRDCEGIFKHDISCLHSEGQQLQESYLVLLNTWIGSDKLVYMAWPYLMHGRLKANETEATI